MIKSPGVRTLLAVALLLVVLVAAALVGSSIRPVMAASNCTYYNNAAHTTVVGQFGRDCCNNPVSWGKKSQFSVCGGCFVCVPPPQ